MLMGKQLSPACLKVATQMNWQCPMAVRAQALSSAQQRRLTRVGAAQSIIVRDHEDVWRMWDAPGLSDLILADDVSDD